LFLKIIFYFYRHIKNIRFNDLQTGLAEFGTDFDANKNVAPERYLTHKEFWYEADKRIINICRQYGVLQ
jgi:hypothetical protein